MEVELKELLNDLQSIKKSISDPSHLALIDKMHLHAENIATLEKSGTTRRSKVKLVDSNPYSRLMALQRMGIVDNYERIREFSLAIVVDGADVRNSGVLPEGIVHELPVADEYPKQPITETVGPTDDLEELRRQLEALNAVDY